MIRTLFSGFAKTAPPAPDLWALALSAPYYRQSGNPYDTLAPYRRLGQRTSREMLRSAWGIDGIGRKRRREQARATLIWLRDAGHRRDLADPGDIEALRDFLAWDAARLVHVARHAHHAGYLDETEAWIYVRAMAPLVQDTFPSWMEYGRRFGRGRLRWLTERDPEFEAAVAWLSNASDSPWQKLPWSTPLHQVSSGPESQAL